MLKKTFAALAILGGGALVLKLAAYRVRSKG